MIDKSIYRELKNRFGHTSSFTIWDSPEDNVWNSKSNIDNLDIFNEDDKICELLNGDFIFVGLNPAKHEVGNKNKGYWSAFHCGDTKRAQDYKLRRALKDSKFWGSFITDIYPEIVETDSSKALNKAKGSVANASIKNILDAREILGGNAVLIAMGNKAYRILKKELKGTGVPLVKIMHYSAFIGPEKYKIKIKEQLKDY